MRLTGVTVFVGFAAAACQNDGAPAASAVASQTGLVDAAPSQAPPKARPKLPTLVTLSGEYSPPPPASASQGPRVFSRAMRSWIYAQPTRKSGRVGYLRAGASSPTSAEAVSRDDCKGGWYPVEPDGFVCVGKRWTLDANDPVVLVTARRRPDASRKLPYIYGTVRRPGPSYARLPSSAELASAEPDLEDRMQRWLEADGELGASYGQEVWAAAGTAPVEPALAWREKTSDELPVFLGNGGSVPTMLKQREPGSLVIGRMRPRVGHAFLETFLHQGRRYGLSANLELVPTDRFRPIRGSDFHGVAIGNEITFPFAFVRRPDARLWLHQSSKKRLIDAGNAPYRAAVKLTGKQRFFEGRLHYETADGKWLSDRDASRLDPAKRMPAWGKNGEKWIDVNLTKQTIVLFEGTKPVYATLISSGEAGLEDHKHSTATKRGIFRIHTKHLTATMDSDEAGEEFELRDVPYVQYFDEGYAMHGAYWHDRFGVPKSHGCINLSPEDARRIFFWTEPQIPHGWHGVLLPLKGTVLFVHP